MSEKRKGDTLKGIPKSIHKRELILDEEEFDASSSGGGEEILYFVFLKIFLSVFIYIYAYSSLYIIVYHHLSSLVISWKRSFYVYLRYRYKKTPKQQQEPAALGRYDTDLGRE